MKMGEVAERAGVPIGSLYQFFPDKGAIIRALAERFTAESRACIDAALADVPDEQGLFVAFAELVDTYYAICLAEPVMGDIWSGTQADKSLRELELADSRASADTLARAWNACARRGTGGAGFDGISHLAARRSDDAIGDFRRSRRRRSPRPGL